MTDFATLLNARVAAEYFDPKKQISHTQIQELIEQACQAPSSFNLQHWRFVAITDREKKERIKEVTLPSNRERVIAAPAAIMVLGDLQAHDGIGKILEDSVSAGVLAQGVADSWLTAARSIYEANPALARDEAIKSCSLAAMTLMLAAANIGLVTCPIGFDPIQVKEILNISDRHIPVIMLLVGHPSPGNTQRRPRLPVDDILRFNSSEFPEQRA